MWIELTRSGDSYRADCKDLPGTPPVGVGRTKEESVASLFLSLLRQPNWLDYIKPNELLVTEPTGAAMNYRITLERPVETVHVTCLGVGDLAIVAEEAEDLKPGDIVLRGYGVLVCLNRPNLAWTSVLPHTKVRRLAPGEKLVIEGNGPCAS